MRGTTTAPTIHPTISRSNTVGGTGTAGVANRGLNRWGIAVRRGQRMEGRLYVRAARRTSLTVALQSADDSRTYALRLLEPGGTDWTRRDFALTPNATDARARFAIWSDRPGSAEVDQVYL